jgi:thioredoxin:protein disulfide reductase
MATLLLIGGVFFAWPNPHAEVASSWKKYDEKTLAAAKAEGKPIIIDFYADWCIPCKELDAKTFSDPKVAKELDRFTRIKADLTRAEDAKTKALTKEYAILGVPTIVIIDSKGQELKASRLTGFEGAEPFLERIRSVR